MSDINLIGGNSTYSDAGLDALTGSASSLNTGALRRKYNFGDYVSELALAQDPFFRFVSQVAKKPTDDPEFKFTEKRGSYTKRYSYMQAYDASAAANPATDPDGGNHTAAAGDTYTFEMYTDYNSNGNKQNVYGQTIVYKAGVTGTQPGFFIPGQLIKLPVFSSSGSLGSPTGYEIWKVNSVDTTSQDNFAVLNCSCVKGASSVKYMDPALVTGSGYSGAALSQEALEPYRAYVVGTAHAAGSGYPETWADQPYMSSTGQTQIFKTSCVMNNTDRATVLKYEGNEWSRIWKEKLIEHKYDIESALLFGKQSSAYNTTEGAVDFISTYGNVFSLDTASKTQDDFLDDLSVMMDPRYNNAGATVFFCSTAVYNWLHKMSGYFQNNIEISPNYRADFSISGKKKVMGIDITTISTVYGDMNVARNIHLDGTSVKMLGINMKYCAYRPLVGNGVNRDTGVYVGVQTLENSGVDRRVDLILTEAGMEWCCPETHAIWS